VDQKENPQEEDNVLRLISEFKKRGTRVVFKTLYFWAGILFSIKGNWFCYINSRSPLKIKKWTLAHELGHLVLHRDSSSLFTDGIFPAAEEDAEWQANRFAAELLMPKHSVLDVLDCSSRDDIRMVFEISQAFDVPVSAAAWWLRELNMISSKAYKYLISAYREV